MPRPPSVRWPQAQSSHQQVKVVRNASATPAQVFVGRTGFKHDPVRKIGSAPTPEEVMGACTPPCNPVGVSHAVVGCRDPVLVLLFSKKLEGQSATAAPPLANWAASETRGQEEETFAGSRSHQASRCSQSRGRSRGERLAGLKAELAREASAHCQSPLMLVVVTRLSI